MVSWSTVAALLLACLMYGAFCAAAVRAFLRRCADRVAYRLAATWGGCFAAAIVGTLMVSDAFGLDIAVAFEALMCAASFALCAALGRWWRNREMAAAVTYLQLHRPVPAPVPAPAPAAPPTLDLEAHCARIARAYDLTRREEDVLSLLMEGCTFAQAADSLVVSLNTVKSHVRHLYAKMGVTGKQDLLDKVSSDS